MKREAHFKDLAQCCACHACYVKRRVNRVTNRLRGIKPTPKEPSFQFGFTGWKQFAHDDQLDTLRYGILSNLYTANPRSSFKLEGV